MTHLDTTRGLWQKLKARLPAFGSKQEPQEMDPAKLDTPCCTPVVHIAYRGKSDERMYMAYNRTWQEVRFFQHNGLRVFCAQCRRRVY